MKIKKQFNLSLGNNYRIRQDWRGVGNYLGLMNKMDYFWSQLDANCGGWRLIFKIRSANLARPKYFSNLFCY